MSSVKAAVRLSDLRSTSSTRSIVPKSFSRYVQLPCSDASGLRQLSTRNNNTSNRRNNEGKLQMYALPFSVSPDKAISKFYDWAYKEQGLNYILSTSSVKIGAAYCPFWAFDINTRFVVIRSSDGRRILGWKPKVFDDAFQNQTVIHTPGLAAYAGYSYRRSLLNPLHNISLVFLADDLVPFGQWMLKDMRLSNGAILEVYPDPWNTTRGRALAVVKEELEKLATESTDEVEVQTETLASKRVYMPTYYVDYKVLGIEYRCFVSGCDLGAGVSGDSHKVFDTSSYENSRSFLSQAFTTVRTGVRVIGPRGILVAVNLLGSILGRLLLRLPLIGAVVGTFVGFRKVLMPYFSGRRASAEWERQREHESLMDDKLFDHKNDFVDSGAAKEYFKSNRGRILNHLSGEYDHERGDFDWYSQWEKWARQQWQNQQQQQQGRHYEQQQNTGPQRTTTKKRVDYHWDFNPNDPYSVLGIRRGATATEVSAAYRKQMLAYHPDMQSGKSDAERARSDERSKLINEAYRAVKQEMKSR